MFNLAGLPFPRDRSPTLIVGAPDLSEGRMIQFLPYAPHLAELTFRWNTRGGASLTAIAERPYGEELKLAIEEWEKECDWEGTMVFERMEDLQTEPRMGMNYSPGHPHVRELVKLP